MVERTYQLDFVFGCLSDPTRRDILGRVNKHAMSVSAIAENYDFSLAGIAKHLSVLERAGLIHKERQGKEQIVSIDPNGLAAANDYLETYRELWEHRLDSLDTFVTSFNKRR
jgi:DNA-binding transcriptional ArsR family regulator